MTENMSSFEKWRNDKLMFLDGKATDFLNGLAMMKNKNLLSAEDYRKITDCQLQAYDMAVEMNFESDKINFLDGLKKAPYPEDFFSSKLQDAKNLMETDEERQNVKAGLKQFTTIKGSQYMKIISDYELFKSGKLKCAFFAFNRNMLLTGHYKYLKWLELEKSASIKEPVKKRPEPITYQWIKQPDIQLPKLYSRLIDGGFIAPETSSETFTACFTGQPVQIIPEKIKWLKSKALLAYFIYGIRDEVKFTDHWDIAKHCFDKGSDLSNTRNQYLNTKTGLPKGYPLIDEVLYKL